MAGDETKGDAPQPVGEDGLTHAERKRLEARRRFLAGGAVALPLIVSVSRETFAFHYYNDDDDDKNKKLVGRSLCVSIGIKSKNHKKNTFNSVMCKVQKS